MKKKIFISGHKGLVGSAILKNLIKNKNLKIVVKSRNELDLKNFNKLLKFFKKEKFDHVYNCAAQVGGIIANIKYPADFINENLIIQNNIINASFKTNVKKFLFLGSSCIYPIKKTKLSENDLLKSNLEKTNEYYSIAKIAGLKLCESLNKQYRFKTKFINVMPCNLFGENDNFHPQNSHAIAALVKKICDAKSRNLKKIEIWGTGEVKREFLHSNDLAKICIYLMNINFEKIKKIYETNENHIINIGSNDELTIKNLAKKILKITNHNGQLFFNKKKPDGVKRKILDTKNLKKIGFKGSLNFDKRLKEFVNYYQSKYGN